MSSSAQTFQDTFSQEYTIDNLGPASYYGDTGLPGFVMKLTGVNPEAIRDYARTQDDRAYERASINSARAWEEYLDNTKYQRAVEDMKKAGLNPWLAVQNGMPGTGTPSVDTGGSARNHSHSGQSSNSLAMLLIAVARLLAIK